MKGDTRETGAVARGAEHGDIPFSVILVHSVPGTGPKPHRHPHTELFNVESARPLFGSATRGSFLLTAIQGAPEFTTEWLAGVDPAWIP
jgi:hypothetical protein